jgi:DNA-binding MarR family transcriptional regulator
MASGDRPDPGLAEPPREAWATLFTLSARLVRDVERRLREEGLPPLSWYDVLWSLYSSEEECVTQRQLADRIAFSPSGLSRLIDRMVSRGVVERSRPPGDRRSASLAVTGDGVELMREMWVHYGGAIAEHFAPAIAGREGELNAMLGAAVRSLESGGAGLRTADG